MNVVRLHFRSHFALTVDSLVRVTRREVRNPTIQSAEERQYITLNTVKRAPINTLTT